MLFSNNQQEEFSKAVREKDIHLLKKVLFVYFEEIYNYISDKKKFQSKQESVKFLAEELVYFTSNLDVIAGISEASNKEVSHQIWRMVKKATGEDIARLILDCVMLDERKWLANILSQAEKNGGRSIKKVLWKLRSDFFSHDEREEILPLAKSEKIEDEWTLNCFYDYYNHEIRSFLGKNIYSLDSTNPLIAETLIISSDICIIDERISEFKNLRLIYIEKCNKISIDINISKLHKLERIEFFYCSKLTIPPEISELKKLKRIEFFCCSELSITSNISKLKNLKSIYIGHCDIDHFPAKEIAKLPSLEEMVFDYNSGISSEDIELLKQSLPNCKFR